MLATALLSPVPRARTKKTVQNAVGRRAPGGSPNRALAPNERSEFLGLDPKEGVFGFKPLPELLVGRFAMLGFATGLTNEAMTGHPILQQVGLSSPSPTVLEILVALLGGAIAVAAFDTAVRLKENRLPPADAARYQYFLAHPLGEDDEDGIFSSRGGAASSSASEDAESCPTPTWISDDEIAAMHAANARDMEVANGRWAMLGFASAILVEAATGDGVIPQALHYANALGLTGVSPSGV